MDPMGTAFEMEVLLFYSMTNKNNIRNENSTIFLYRTYIVHMVHFPAMFAYLHCDSSQVLSVDRINTISSLLKKGSTTWVCQVYPRISFLNIEKPL